MHRVRRIGMSDEKLILQLEFCGKKPEIRLNSPNKIHFYPTKKAPKIFRHCSVNLLSVSTVYNCNTFGHHIDNDSKIYHIVWGGNVAIGHKYIFHYGPKGLGGGS